MIEKTIADAIRFTEVLRDLLLDEPGFCSMYESQPSLDNEQLEFLIRFREYAVANDLTMIQVKRIFRKYHTKNYMSYWTTDTKSPSSRMAKVYGKDLLDEILHPKPSFFGLLIGKRAVILNTPPREIEFVRGSE